MAQLTIENSSVGFDQAGMDQVYQDIKANLIDSIITELTNTVPTVRDHVDEYWVGAAADAFKEKLDVDTETIKTRLTEISDALEGELHQMAMNVNNSDQTIAESIRGMTSGSRNHSNDYTSNLNISTSNAVEVQALISDNTSITKYEGVSTGEVESVKIENQTPEQVVQESIAIEKSLNLQSVTDAALSENQNSLDNTQEVLLESTQNDSLQDNLDEKEENLEELSSFEQEFNGVENKLDEENSEFKIDNANEDIDKDANSSVEDLSETGDNSQQNNNSSEIDEETINPSNLDVSQNETMVTEEQEILDSNISNQEISVQSSNQVIDEASTFTQNSTTNDRISNTTVDTSKYNDKPEAGFLVTSGNATYNIEGKDLEVLTAIVCAESDKSYDDALAVASVILNRCEDPAWVGSFGTNPLTQATAPNQFVVYQHGAYKKYLGDNVDPTVQQAVLDALAGVRNNEYLGFRSNGSTSYSDNMITETGNRYN